MSVVLYILAAIGAATVAFVVCSLVALLRGGRW